MRLAKISLFLSMAGLLLAGCQPAVNITSKLGPAQNIVNDSVQACGGLADWQKVKLIRANAIIASYDADGVKTVDRVKLAIDIWGGMITARGDSHQGEWTILVIAGQCTVTGSPAIARDTLCKELPTILHRVGGPLNLLTGREQVLSVHRDRVEGVRTNKVSVEGPGGVRMAYYFDSTSNFLRFVTEGSEVPGENGTVTIYGARESYAMLPNGLILPRSFRVVTTGQNVMVGQTPLFEVDLSDLKAE